MAIKSGSTDEGEADAARADFLTALKAVPVARRPRRMPAHAPHGLGGVPAPAPVHADTARLTAQIAALSSELAAARERERALLALELHDELGAALTGARFALARAQTALAADAPAASGIALANVDRSLDALCDAVQRIIELKRPPELARGLGSALRAWSADFAARTRLEIRVRISDETRLTELSRDAALALFRVAQEALTNAAKHAGANEVELTLAADRRHTTLTVKDDGRGIERRVRGRAGGLGLSGMRERCAAFGGELKIGSIAGRGTTVRVRLPWSTETRQASDQ